MVCFFSVFFSNRRRAAAVCASFGIYHLRRCMESIKLFNYLKILVVIVFRWPQSFL